MRGFFILILIYLFLCPIPSDAIFQKRDYKKNFLQDAINAEKRRNDKSAFHLYEKTMYYYKNDKDVMEAYAGFCERRNYFDKAQDLYQRLYDLTKDNKYLYKRNLAIIKKTNMKIASLQKLAENKNFNLFQRKELQLAILKQGFFQNDWKTVKKLCTNFDKEKLEKDIVQMCSTAYEKTYDYKNAYVCYLRLADLTPKDSIIINKILDYAEKNNDYLNEEKFIKRLSALNPTDNGIKYRLAGLYVKHGEYKKANKVYEDLIASGDTSKYVMDSYTYSRRLSNPPRIKIKDKFVYVAKPKIITKEDLLYKALSAKNYKKADFYLDKILKMNPNDTKMLKLKVDIASAQKDYKTATVFLEKLILINKKSKKSTIESEKVLAYYCTQIPDFPKALDIIDNLLIKNPNDIDLLNLAIEYSMAQEKWDLALNYTNKALLLSPNSEKLLKIQGDMYSAEQNFNEAIKSYEKLVQTYPNEDYRLVLANLYQANQDFANAQTVLEPVYNSNPTEKTVNLYLNILMAQDKLQEAYSVVTKHHLENTKEGSQVLGDIAMLNKNYRSAQNHYLKALNLDLENSFLKDKLAQAYRGQKKINQAKILFNEILAKDPEDIKGQMGLGYIELDRENSKNARKYFNKVLEKHPDSREAKMGIYYSYANNIEYMNALDTLYTIEPDDEVKTLKAKNLYDMTMYSDAKKALKGVVTKDANKLRYDIKRENAITITPSYSFMIQKLAENFKLDLNKIGVDISENIGHNTRAYLDYNMYIYSSGNFDGGNQLNNVTNELKFGYKGRPIEKFEYKADVGCKFFQFGGLMANTDSWIKYYFNDKFNIKAGFKRDNIEQSYLSAVGYQIDGNFTGRAAENKAYLEYEAKFPKKFYSFGRVGGGGITASNMANNSFMEGMVGIGRVIYNNPENKWLQIATLDLVSYNASYQFNLLNVYNAAGTSFGGYFSPSYFTANTANAKIEGKIKKWHLKYGLKGFAGEQMSLSPDFNKLTWGYSPYIAYDLNDHITFNITYSFFNYADVQRHFFTVNAVIRRF